MAHRPEDLDDAAIAFMAERHLATLTTTMGDGALHVVPVGFTYDVAEHTVRIVTRDGSVKVRNADRGGHGALGFVDRGRWMSLHGTLQVRREPERVADTLRRYAEQYQPARPTDAARVSLELIVDLVRGRWA